MTSTAPLAPRTPEDIRAVPYGYLTGTAGTGKTTLARRWADWPDAILCATTGIASVNLGGEATTINTLLGYFDTASLTELFISGFLSVKLRKLYRAGVRRLVLDEVSMLSADQLTLLIKALEEVNGRGFVLDGDDTFAEQFDSENDPMGLTLVGDFCQLAPVKAPYAFVSPEWYRYTDHTCLLTKIHRQTDQDFVHALQAVRRGDATTALEFFGPRLISVTDGAFAGSTIFAKNDAVSRYNGLRMDQLTTPVEAYKATRWGKLRGEWGSDPKKQARWGIPPAVQLKPGALVMILANKRYDEATTMRYVNGDLATYLGQGAAGALVKLQRTDREETIEYITRTNTIPLEVGRRAQLKADGQEARIDGKMEIVGGITYLPLRVAYATTVHKSQGLTLDRVQINIRDHFFRSYGMLYVALSRCRTAEGLRLVGTAEGFVDRCRVDPLVKSWA